MRKLTPLWQIRGMGSVPGGGNRTNPRREFWCAGFSQQADNHTKPRFVSGTSSDVPKRFAMTWALATEGVFAGAKARMNRCSSARLKPGPDTNHAEFVHSTLAGSRSGYQISQLVNACPPIGLMESSQPAIVLKVL